MKKFLFLSARYWLIAGSITIVTACAFYLWIGYAKPICALEMTPFEFIYRIGPDLQGGQHFSKDELAARYSGDILASVYTLTFSGPDDHLTLIFTPRSYDRDWGVSGRRSKFEFDTQSLKVKTYDERGTCNYSVALSVDFSAMRDPRGLSQ